MFLTTYLQHHQNPDNNCVLPLRLLTLVFADYYCRSDNSWIEVLSSQRPSSAAERSSMIKPIVGEHADSIMFFLGGGGGF